MTAYRLTADDGSPGSRVSLDLTRSQAANVMRDAILNGVVASQEIEGEKPVDPKLVSELADQLTIPDSMLRFPR